MCRPIVPPEPTSKIDIIFAEHVFKIKIEFSVTDRTLNLHIFVINYHIWELGTDCATGAKNITNCMISIIFVEHVFNCYVNTPDRVQSPCSLVCKLDTWLNRANLGYLLPGLSTVSISVEYLRQTEKGYINDPPQIIDPLSFDFCFVSGQATFVFLFCFLFFLGLFVFCFVEHIFSLEHASFNTNFSSNYGGV